MNNLKKGLLYFFGFFPLLFQLYLQIFNIPQDASEYFYLKKTINTGPFLNPTVFDKEGYIYFVRLNIIDKNRKSTFYFTRDLIPIFYVNRMEGTFFLHYFRAGLYKDDPYIQNGIQKYFCRKEVYSRLGIESSPAEITADFYKYRDLKYTRRVSTKCI